MQSVSGPLRLPQTTPSNPKPSPCGACTCPVRPCPHGPTEQIVGSGRDEIIGSSNNNNKKRYIDTCQPPFSLSPPPPPPPPVDLLFFLSSHTHTHTLSLSLYGEYVPTLSIIHNHPHNNPHNHAPNPNPRSCGTHSSRGPQTDHNVRTTFSWAQTSRLAPSR